jgi:primosomal protein N' (replication factor Y)
MVYADIILPLPLEGVFTYSVPDGMTAAVMPGMRVVVPFGRSKKYIGVVLRTHGEKPSFDVKDILSLPDPHPIVTGLQLRLWQWIADYYMSPLGDVFKAALPGGLKDEDGYRPKTERCVTLPEKMRSGQSLHVALNMLVQTRARKQRELFECFLAMSRWDEACSGGSRDSVTELTCEELLNEAHATTTALNALVTRGFLTIYEREVGRVGNGGEPHPENMKTLGDAQRKAFEEIQDTFRTKNVTLLHGVTSSGKTEIYIHLIDKTLREGGQVLYLLPEIALTVQIMKRLRNVFGDRMGIYHSKYSDAERVEIWKRQLSDNPYGVILGARSALFLPFSNLRLVIVDEEHETSFKQQDPAPRYHARSAAIMLASMCGAKVLLGSATPSAESYSNALTGKYGLVSIMTRYKNIQLPEIQVVDVKDLRRRKMMNGPFSPALLAAVREALADGRQAILFHNRRGFAPMTECHVCGWVPHCDKCDVSLTLHKSLGRLTCHYCGSVFYVPDRCPCCGSTDLRARGYGTENIEDRVRDIFPEARISRMDLDTTRTRNAYERIIGEFSSGHTNLLIGTQMVSKGLDFGNVAVVGILDADTMLNNPDFRAYEHAFMMMSQVAGRAGRKGSRGKVILQTRNPELPVIGEVVRNDFKTFYKELFEERRMFRYPPFSHIVCVYLRHRDARVADDAAADMARLLRAALGDRVLGPDRPSVARVKTMSIRKILIKLENGISLPRVRECLRSQQSVLMQNRRYATLETYYDVDPL